MDRADSTVTFLEMLNIHLLKGTANKSSGAWDPKEFSQLKSSRGNVLVPLTTLKEWQTKHALPYKESFKKLLQALQLDEASLSKRPDAERKAWAAAFEEIWKRENNARTRAPRTSRAMPTPMQPVELRSNAEYYVGREKTMSSIIDRLTQPSGHIRVVAVTGSPGMGKSTLAAQLAENDLLRETFPDGVLWAALGREANQDIALQKLREWLIRANAQVDTSSNTLVVDAQRAFKSRKILFIIDDVFNDAVASTLRVGGSGCGVIVTSRYLSVARKWAQGAKNIFELIKFDELTSKAYVKLHAPDAFNSDFPSTHNELLKRLSSIDGHPLLLHILAKGLQACGDDHAKLHSTITTFTGENYEAMIKGSMAMQTRRAQKALRRLCVLAPDPMSFSAALAKLAIGLEPSIGDVILEELEQFGFIRSTSRAPNDTLKSPTIRDEHQFFTIHRSISDILAPQRDSEIFQHVCETASNYYLEKLSSLESADSDFQAWLRHETTEWRNIVFSVGFYVARMKNNEKTAFKLTHAWISSFWWWGTFTRDGFDFCDQIIVSLPDTSGAPWQADRAALSTILNHYPNEASSGRGTRREDWRHVRFALEILIERRGLKSDLTSLSSEQNELLGLLVIFIAESYRFGEKDFKTAIDRYQAAESAFVRVQEIKKDCWALSWVRFHLADCLFETGDDSRVGEAEAICKNISQYELSSSAGDQEVLARCRFLMGRAGLVAGLLNQALEGLHDAIYWAYRYQFFAQLAGCVGVPDAYTAAYYSDMCIRVAALLMKNANASDAGFASTTKIVGCLANKWGNAIDGHSLLKTGVANNDATTLAEQIFPRAFKVSDLKNEEHVRSYTQECKRNLHVVAPSIAPTCSGFLPAGATEPQKC